MDNIQISLLENLFACPHCRSRVQIIVDEENQTGIENGKITCSECKNEYSIENGIINWRIEKAKGDGLWKVDDFKNLCVKGSYWRSHTEWLERKFPEINPVIIKGWGEYEANLMKGRLLKWINPKYGNIILDVGCGVGYFLFDIGKSYSKEELILIGLDAEEDNIKLFSRRLREENNKNMLAMIADIENLPFRNSKIDILTCSEVLEHVYSPNKAIKEMSRVIKTNGKILISTPNKKAEDRWNFIFEVLKKLTLKKTIPSQEFRKQFYDRPLESTFLRQGFLSANLAVKKNEFNIKASFIARRLFKYLPFRMANKIIYFLEKIMNGEKWGECSLWYLKKNGN